MHALSLFRHIAHHIASCFARQTYTLALGVALVVAAYATASTLIPHTAFADETISAAPGVSITTTETTYPTPLPAGTYHIQSSLKGQLFLAVESGSKKNGANVRIITQNNSNALRWKISYDKQGLYTFKNLASNKYLTLKSGKTKNEQNIYQWANKKTEAQKWIITKNGSGYSIAAAKNENYQITVAGGKAKSTTNVQLNKAKKAASQRWWFIAEKPSITSDRTIDDGIYEISFTKNTGYAVAVASTSTANGKNIQLGKANGAVTQRWGITRGADGFYTIKNVITGKAIHVKDNSFAARTNILSYKSTSSAAQRWAIQQNSNGSYTFVNKSTGLALEVAGAKAKQKANVRTGVATYGAAQQFTLKPIDALPNGTYKIYTWLSPTKLTLGNNARSAERNIKLQKQSASMLQKYCLTKIANNTYTITALSNSWALEAKGTKVSLEEADASKDSQKWRVSFTGNGLMFHNVATGKPLSLVGGSKKVGTKVQAEKVSKANAMRFRLVPTKLVSNGSYALRNGNHQELALRGDTYKNKTNVVASTLVPSCTCGKYIFYIQSVKGGYYKILNAASFKALEVKDGSKKTGANVYQSTYTGKASQLWKPALENGGIVFINKASGNVLHVTSKENAVSSPRTGVKAQRWTLIPVEYSLTGNTNLDKKLAKILGNLKGSTNAQKLRSAYNYTVALRYRTSSHVGGNGWTVGFAHDMINKRSGNCYRYAALFMWLARGLGYDARAITGSVPSLAGGQAPHGWVEIITNGKTYVYDPDLQHEIGINFYQKTYANAPVAYTKHKSYAR